MENYDLAAICGPLSILIWLAELEKIIFKVINKIKYLYFIHCFKSFFNKELTECSRISKTDCYTLKHRFSTFPMMYFFLLPGGSPKHSDRLLLLWAPLSNLRTHFGPPVKEYAHPCTRHTHAKNPSKVT